MKKLKFLSALMCLPMLFTGIACGETGGTTLEITAQDAGYGIAWIEEVALAYEEETGVKVDIFDVTTSMVDNELSILQSFLQTYIRMLKTVLF